MGLSGHQVVACVIGAVLAAASPAVAAPPDDAGLPAAGAQMSAEPAGRARALTGRVVDADGGDAIPDADVTLLAVPSGEPVPDSLTEDWERRYVRARRETDASGGYRFDDVLPGLYLVRVTRIGYRPATVRVEWAGSASSISVALSVEPIRLEPLEVAAPGTMIVRGADGATQRLGRVAAERMRQETALVSDARIVGDPDLREAATLGEMDIFRAIQRLPGVSTRDDYTAEIWTRGATWGETRVYMDGVPLFNPLHGFGVLSGVSHRGLGAASFHPGVRPVRIAEGSAAVLELTSASGAGLDGVEAGADLTLASAHAWGRGPLGEAGGWGVTARRSWADLVASGVSDDPTAQFPYAFSDLLLRADVPVGDESALEISALHESDVIRGEIPDVLHRTSARWGNDAAQATWSFPLGGLRARQALGAARYAAEVKEIPGELDDDFSAPSEPPADHRVHHLALHGEVRRTDGSSWAGGYDLIHQSARYEGPEPWPYYGPRPLDPPIAEVRGAHTRIDLWGRRRWEPIARLEIESGLRVTFGSATPRGRIGLQPSASARIRLTSDLSLSAGLGRFVQYAQSPAAMGPLFGTGLETGRLWYVAGPARAPLSAVIATAGGEAWLGDDWLLSATAYRRTSSDVLLPDPTPGFIVQRPPLVSGRVEASGVDVTLRRLAGRVTGSLAYSLGRARAEAAGRDFDAPTDRRHVLDATAQLRISSSVDVQAAYTWASGAPYTRVLPTYLGTEQVPASILEDPFARRSPGYSSLDLVLEWTARFRGWSLGAYVQGRNVLRHDNAVTYESTELSCGYDAVGPDGFTCPDGTPAERRDGFYDGIPLIPLLGIRVTF